LFYFRDYVKKLQVIQKAVDKITINLVLKDSEKIQEAKKDFENVNKEIRSVMGSDTKIKYNILDEIKPSKAGKYMYAFSRVKK